MSVSTTASNSINFPGSITERLQVQHLLEPTQKVSTIAGSDVIRGLTQTPKTLPFKYLYDDRGSELFEQICELPEYYPTRTETKILQKSSHEIAEITGTGELVELGSGSSTKTRILLDAYQDLGYTLHYLPIDVSAGILEISAKQLLLDYPSLEVRALVGTYERALSHLQPTKLPTRTIAFIGSSLGNMNPQECDRFFAKITDALQPGEYFLLGIDLQKPKDILEAAYDDSQGVTAAFNLNMLEHLNRRFEGNFDTNQFSHWAFYNEVEQRIEMHLKSAIAQTVELKSLNLQVDFTAQETIRTEISRKFDLDTIQQNLKAYGLIPQQVWTDENQWFGLILSRLF
ncbi:MAG: L-histidine N(alpha)-methyltransferase [Calothrix sp. MO_167.B42]|nr:L-histidine N(alpha)-methyltransferase [Calothrix sp. MO_167.B42]